MDTQPNEPPQLDVVLSQLRSLVTACAARYQHESAAWFANKAVTLSGAAPRDVYALADALFCSGDAPRALRTLELYNFLDASAFLNPDHAASMSVAGSQPTEYDTVVMPASRVQPQWLPFFYLAAQCLKRMKAWDRCLALLADCMEGPTAPALETPLSLDPLLERPPVHGSADAATDGVSIKPQCPALLCCALYSRFSQIGLRS